MPDLFDHRQPPERQVGDWILRSDIPITRDKQERHHSESRAIDWPFEHMRLNECFEVTPEMVGARDLLRTANKVSSAASQFKYGSKDICGNITRDFKTGQFHDAGVVRCWRIL